MPRQFKSTDTSTWTEQFGTGKHGSLTVSSGTFFRNDTSPFTNNGNGFANFTGTSGNTSGTAVDSWTFNLNYLTAGDYVLIHQSGGTGAGNWELNVITGTVGSGTWTVNFKYPLQNTYTTGAQIVSCPQFTDITFNAGTNITQKNWDPFKWGGIIAFFCNGKTTITGNLYTSSQGFAGGEGRDFGSTAFTGWNTGNDSLQQTAASNNGGGGSDGDNGAGRGASGGGGGSYTAGGAGGTEGGGAAGGGAGNTTATTSELTLAVFGGGGGGGSRTGSGSYPRGGFGGGSIFIFSKEIEITGYLSSDGGNGVQSGDGGSGGGAGGTVLIKSITATLGTTRVNAIGGSGAYQGGAGGTGRIHLDYASSYTGTTNPTLSATQDSSLYPSGGAFIYNLL